MSESEREDDTDTEPGSGSDTDTQSRSESSAGGDGQVATVDLPWVDEPVELAEAVELIARADQDDEEVINDVRERVAALTERVDRLEDGSAVSCPSCGETDAVYTAGVGAALLANDGDLGEENAAALNRDSHVCIDCSRAFTPSAD